MTGRLLRAAGALAALTLPGCAEEDNRTLPAPVPAVKYEVVRPAGGGERRALSGKLAAAGRSQLSFPAGGRVSEVLADQGDRVVKDQPLARLETRDFELVRGAAQAQLGAARGRVQEAQEELRRKRILFDKDLVARAALDKAQAAYDTAQGEAGVAESRLAQAVRDLERTVLRAPFGGRIAVREVDPFTEVKGGQSLFTLETVAALEVRVLVPETLITQVDYGQAVAVSFPGQPQIRLGGVVARIDSEALTGNAFEVTIRLTGTHPDLRPGMTASAGFEFARAPAGEEAGAARVVFLIPLPALSLRGALSDRAGGQGPGAAPVYVYDAACACARRRLIEIGGVRGNRIEVFAGLQAGERLISAGTGLLHDGMKVRLWQPAPGGGAPGQ